MDRHRGGRHRRPGHGRQLLVHHAVATATNEAFKDATARYTATELLTRRAVVSADVVKTLQTKLDQFGLTVIAVDMTQFQFDKAYLAQINKKVIAEQETATALNVLERTKVEQQTQVEQARAQAEATKLRVDAEAYATMTAASARAKAIEHEARALRENSNVLELRRVEVELKKAEQWNGALPTHLYGSAPVPFMSVGR